MSDVFEKFKIEVAPCKEILFSRLVDREKCSLSESKKIEAELAWEEFLLNAKNIIQANDVDKFLVMLGSHGLSAEEEYKLFKYSLDNGSNFVAEKNFFPISMFSAGEYIIFFDVTTTGRKSSLENIIDSGGSKIIFPLCFYNQNPKKKDIVISQSQRLLDSTGKVVRKIFTLSYATRYHNISEIDFSEEYVQKFEDLLGRSIYKL